MRRWWKPGVQLDGAVTALLALSCILASVGEGQQVVERSPVPPSFAIVPPSIGIAAATAKREADSVRRRPRAIEYSDWYARRLVIHRVGSYVELPLFGAEYLLGNDLLDGNAANWERSAHSTVAGGLGVLFTVNTVTGVWNLVESRKDPAGRARRLLHSALMIGADAGFAWAGLIAGDARESESGRDRHTRIAIASMGLSTAGTLMMWLWNN